MVTSRQNVLVKRLHSLRQRKSRDEKGTFLAEGVKVVAAALESRVQVRCCVFTGEAGCKVDRLRVRAESQGIQCVEVSPEVLEYLANTRSPQGLLAEVVAAPSSLDGVHVGQRGLAYVLDGVADPGNLGTILRVADAVAAAAVLTTKESADLYNPKVVRATAGSLFHVPAVGGLEVTDLLRWTERERLPLFVCEPDAAVSVFDIEFPPRVGLVFGNEARGIGPQLRQAASQAVRLPILGRAESLNVAVACAALSYEVVRQWRAEEACYCCP